MKTVQYIGKRSVQHYGEDAIRRVIQGDTVKVSDETYTNYYKTSVFWKLVKGEKK